MGTNATLIMNNSSDFIFYKGILIIYQWATKIPMMISAKIRTLTLMSTTKQ